MRLPGSLACLLLALYLGSGEAGPLLSGGASAETGFGEAAGQAVGDAISHGIREAIGQGAGEAAHAFGNTASEAGRQTENVIRHGIDAAHRSWQGMPGSDSAWVSGWKEAGRGDGIGKLEPFAAICRSWVENLGSQWEGEGVLVVAVWGSSHPCCASSLYQPGVSPCLAVCPALAPLYLSCSACPALS